uniref:7TM_GPCR_Srx domain-containing protein n=1 Tax=Heterorhabditis bacteriophora TaxID=37862 RepID=A0A1I7W7Y8_HETBA
MNSNHFTSAYKSVSKQLMIVMICLFNQILVYLLIETVFSCSSNCSLKFPINTSRL